MKPATAEGRGRMPSVALLGLGAVALALAIAAVPLAVLSRQGSPAEPLVVAGSFAVVGLVVARRQPRNPMGWLLVGVGTLLPLTITGSYYAVLVYRLGYRLPFGPVALLLDVSWAAAFMLLPLAILLFPDGRLPSRRWQWILRVYLAVSAAFVIALSWAAANSLGTREPIDVSGGVTAVDTRPAGWPPSRSWRCCCSRRSGCCSWSGRSRAGGMRTGSGASSSNGWSAVQPSA